MHARQFRNASNLSKSIRFAAKPYSQHALRTIVQNAASIGPGVASCLIQPYAKFAAADFTAAERSMRIITQITIALVLLGWLATAIDLPRDQSPHQKRTLIAWRHTVDGWEQTGAWATNSPRDQHLPNPLWVALEEFLVCTLALVALSNPERTVRAAKPDA